MYRGRKKEGIGVLIGGGVGILYVWMNKGRGGGGKGEIL